MNQEEAKIVLENAPVSEPLSSDSSTKSKKPRKEYEWTPKRKEAFEKMRKGLEEKVQITKRIRDEKKRAEKEAIKAKVKEIMSSKKGSMVVQESDSSSDASSSEEEMPKPRKKTHKEKKAISKEIAPKKSSKRKSKEPESSEESAPESASESSEEEMPVRVSDNYSRKQHHHYQKDKVDRGKAVKVAQFVNPLDRFILL